MKKKELVLEEFAKNLDYWVRETVTASTDPDADLTWTENADCFRKIQSLAQEHLIDEKILGKVFEEVLRGYTVSLFSVIDGGSALAEKLQLELRYDDGGTVGELHDEFVMHLISSGRLE